MRPGPVVLRKGIEIADPARVGLELLQGQWHLEIGDSARPGTFDETDLRRANRGGARISAIEIETILGNRRSIDRALRAIPPESSLAGGPGHLPWLPLRQLFDAFAGIRGVGFSKMTKALHGKRPALIPMLDSVVQSYLADDDLGPHAPFGVRGVEFVRGYKRDLDRNRSALRTIGRELAGQGYGVSEVRILDLLIWSVAAPGA